MAVGGKQLAEEFGYEKLEVWQLGMALVDKLYDVTRLFPKEETYGLVLQIRRAGVSVPSNIAEGYGRGSRAGFAASAKISRGSLYEVRTQVEIGYRQKMVNAETNTVLRKDMALLSKKLDAFIRSLEKPMD